MSQQIAKTERLFVLNPQNKLFLEGARSYLPYRRYTVDFATVLRTLIVNGLFLLVFIGVFDGLRIVLYGIDIYSTVKDKYTELESGRSPTAIYIIRTDVSIRGTSHLYRMYVSEDEYDQLNANDTIDIRYLADSDYAVLLSDYSPSAIYIFMIVFIVVLLHNGITVIQYRKFIKRQSNLIRRGQIIFGQIINCVITANKRHGLHTIHFTYTFLSPSTNRKLEGMSKVIRERIKSSGTIPDMGTKVAIYYLNDDFYELL